MFLKNEVLHIKRHFILTIYIFSERAVLNYITYANKHTRDIPFLYLNNVS